MTVTQIDHFSVRTDNETIDSAYFCGYLPVSYASRQYI